MAIMLAVNGDGGGWGVLINTGDQPRCAAAVRIVFLAEMGAKKGFFGVYAQEEGPEDQTRQEDAQGGTKSKRPT